MKDSDRIIKQLQERIKELEEAVYFYRGEWKKNHDKRNK